MEQVMLQELEILETLKQVIDAEVGINIVDLGLVYKVDLSPGTVVVTMTMTTRSCPLGELITNQAQQVLRNRFPQLESVVINLVWSPAWIPSMMSDAAKKQMGTH
jgi:metal-sulfur cluster biosynthetic enzyme